MTRYFYRVTETTYSNGIDECGDPIPGGPTRPNLECYKVLRDTPKGVWIDDYSEHGRFINLSWSKRFACPTVEEAKASFIARKKRQIKIAQRIIDRAEESLQYLAVHGGFYNDARNYVLDGLGVEVPK